MDVQVWRHHIPNDPETFFGGWGVFFLDSLGCLSILSDYGNFGYRWSSFGPDIRKFLLGCDSSYLMEKFLQGDTKVPDVERSTAAIRAHILESRRCGDLDRETARAEWELLLDYESSENTDEWLDSTSIPDGWELLYSKYASEDSMAAFLERTWPRYLEALRADLTTEGFASSS